MPALAILVRGVAIFLSNLFFGGEAELLTSEFRGILSWELTFPMESFSFLMGK